MSKVKITIGSDELVLLPSGRYPVRVEEYEEIESQNGTPGLKWRFKVLSGEYSGKTIIDRTYLTEAAQWRLESLLRAAGVELPPVGSDFILMPKDVNGKVLEVSLAHREYDGKTRYEVKQYDSLVADDMPEKEPGKPAAKKKTKAKKPAGLQVGASATFLDEGEEVSCVVTSIAGNLYTVRDENGDEWELDKEDLSA